MNNWCNSCGLDLNELELTGTCIKCINKNKRNPILIVKNWWRKQSPRSKFFWQIAAIVILIVIEKEYPLFGELMYNLSTCNGRFS